MPDDPVEPQAGHGSEPTAWPAQTGSFPLTQWSVVINAGSGPESQASIALETLCRQYWYPLYSFVRRQGRDHHEAEDCTQEFLARLLAAEGIAHARREQGRFRTFLLTAMRNFLTNEWRRATAAKRGGGSILLSLEFAMAERTFSQEPSDPGLTPEQAFDRNWSLGLIDRVIARLREDYGRSGRRALFEALNPLVWDNSPDEAFAASAARLGMTRHAFTVALHRLRQRVGQRLRADVAETAASDADVDGELRHLLATVSARSGGR